MNVDARALVLPTHKLYTAWNFMYYERIYGFDNLHKAFKLARRGKRWKPATARFEVNLLENLLRLSRELQDKTYELSEYHTFKVYEPKERDVMSNSF